MALGQAGFDHPLLHAGDIIRHPVALPGILIHIQDGVSRAWVAIAWLANRAGVENGARRQGKLRFVFGHHQPGVHGIIWQVIHHRQVRVPNKAVQAIKKVKVKRGGARVQQILPNRLARAAVYQGDQVQDDPLWQALQKAEVGRIQALLGPQNGGARLRVERINLDVLEGRSIMIAQNALQIGQRRNALNAFVGVRAVAHQVAQAPGGVHLAGVSQHSL